ncbi:MAG TPA: EamA/RhaT family transporter, partial [Burkholderiaceae bacterium]|nr:EamA/RhaT family transporter [Burkholderiaceae bacterium]
PTSLAGQLIVFETLAALLYAFALRGAVPSAAALAGIGLLVAGVVLGVRAFQSAASAPASAA